jgi:hypothetical protein
MINKNIYNSIFAFSVFIALTIFLTFIRVNTSIGLYGDTGLHYNLLQNIIDGNGSASNIYASINDFLFKSGLTTQTFQTVCEYAMRNITYSELDINFFNFHTYYILYPLSYLSPLITVPYIIQGTAIFSFLFFALIFYFICRKYLPSRITAIICTLIITMHPAWSWSIMGQPFIDRLFLPFGLLIFYYCDIGKIKYSFFLSLIAILINEKIAIYLALFYFTYAFVFYKKSSSDYAIKCVIFGFLFSILSFVAVKFLLNNPYYSSAILSSPNAIINYISDENNLNGVITFLLINISLIALNFIKNIKYVIIALVMILPNIFSNIGGAEKVGFFTHYHTLYFPFLAYCFIKSIQQTITTSKSNNKYYFSHLIFLIIFYISLNINSTRTISINFNLNNFYINKFYTSYTNYLNYSNLVSEIKDLIPKNSIISASEPSIPYLYNYKNVFLYPINLKHSDFIAIPYSVTNGSYRYQGYFGYLGDVHNLNTNSCLYILMEQYGFKVQAPIFISPGFAIIGK